MSILFMGTEIGAFTPSDSGVKEVTTTAYSNYDTAFCRAATDVYTSTEYAEGALASGQTDVWIHFEAVTYALHLGNAKIFSWLDASSVERIRITHSESGSTLSVEYYNGSWNVIGTATVSLATTRQTLDLHVVCNSVSGSVALYIGGTNRVSGSADLSATTSLKNFRFFGLTVSSSSAHLSTSQVVVSTTSTVGGRLFTVAPNGVGASTDWTGSYANIDEAVYSDADFINSASVNQVSTFAVSAPTLTGYQVLAVAVTARANCGASGPQNLQLALRSAGTNYFSSSKALSAGFTANIAIWETDPATSAAWTNVAVATLQPGVKSIT